ncbi:MAG: hypothetical protein R3B70_27965 [Polyangiaceae bacterium]
MKWRKPLGCLIVAVGLSAFGAAHADSSAPPSEEEIALAEETCDLMTNTVVAALLQEIDETTPDNAAQGSRSISLIFNDRNHDIRLVGTVDPVSDNDYPEDGFEALALGNAMTGAPTESVERVEGKWMLRRSIPLSNFASQCAMCHQSFAGMGANEWVGALMLRVPIEAD